MPEKEPDKGFIIETDEGQTEVGIEEIERMAEEEDPVGMYALGMAYLFGHAVGQDSGKGYDLLEKAAEKGNPDAKALLVNMFFEGDYMGFDTKKAVEYAKDADDAGITEGQLY